MEEKIKKKNFFDLHVLILQSILSGEFVCLTKVFDLIPPDFKWFSIEVLTVDLF